MCHQDCQQLNPLRLKLPLIEIGDSKSAAKKTRCFLSLKGSKHKNILWQRTHITFDSWIQVEQSERFLTLSVFKGVRIVAGER